MDNKDCKDDLENNYMDNFLAYTNQRLTDLKVCLSLDNEFKVGIAVILAVALYFLSIPFLISWFLIPILSKNPKNFFIFFVVLFFILVIACSNLPYLQYCRVKSNIQSKNWEFAYNDIQALKNINYKDSKDLAKEIEYNYFLEMGDKSGEGDLTSALERYKKAIDTGYSDKIAKQKYDDILLKINKQKVEKEKILAGKKAKIAALKKFMRIKTDKVEGITWYYDKTYPIYTNRNHFDLYMGEKGDTHWLRIAIAYAGEDWIFFNKMVANVDGLKFEKTFNSFDVRREVVFDGLLYESIDIPYEDNEILISTIINSRNTIIRLQGDKYYDRTLTAQNKKAIKRVLDLYNLLKN